MMVLIRLALSSLGAAGLVTKLIAAGIVLASILAAYGIWHHKVWRSGYDYAIAAIAAQDKKAIDAAKKARAAVIACADTDGMRWDQSTGQCQRR